MDERIEPASGREGAGADGAGAQEATGTLVIGVPSKGRLQENAAAFFARAGLPLAQARGARDYRGAVAGLDGVEIAFLSASEIAGEVARGAIHFGITGADLLHEGFSDPATKVELLLPLGFGEANVVVAVPEAWIDVMTMADLEDVAASFPRLHGRKLRVATKYTGLTRRHFRAHGIWDYRIVESAGATEGAPAAGTAEAIVDITTTGATLAANGLRVLDDGVILRSEAHLVASLAAPWGPVQRQLARVVLSRIAAEKAARAIREMKIFLPAGLDAAARSAIGAAGASLPFGEGEPGAHGTMLIAHCPVSHVSDLADALVGLGATTVGIAKLDDVFRAENPLYDRLLARLDARAA